MDAADGSTLARGRARTRVRVARTMPIRTGARGLELDEGCPSFRRRFLQSLGDRTRARGWDAAMSRQREAQPHNHPASRFWDARASARATKLS